MVKGDRIYSILRKIDFMWDRKGHSFSSVIKELFDVDIGLTDDEIVQKFKDINPDLKEEK